MDIPGPILNTHTANKNILALQQLAYDAWNAIVWAAAQRCRRFAFVKTPVPQRSMTVLFVQRLEALARHRFERTEVQDSDHAA